MLQPERFARKGILDLKPYVPGKPIEEVKRELGLDHIIKLASNENPIGPSPAALRALERELQLQNQYPEAEAPMLKTKLAAKLGVSPDNIFISNGGDNVISCAMNSLVNVNERVIIGHPTFPTYERAAVIAGAEVVKVPLVNFRYDFQAMLRQVNSNTKMVVVCNPNNPTGLLEGRKELEQFKASLPEDVILFVDEAYYEFVDSNDRFDTLSAVRADNPVISLRTFSKLYGLAGLRVGYAVAPKALVQLMEVARDVFSVSRPAQAAAEAALDDQEFVERSLNVVRQGRQYLFKEFQRLGLEYLPSQSNFIWVRTKVDSHQLFDYMLRKGIIIRPGHIWGYPEYIRVSIGTQAQNEQFIKVLEQALIHYDLI
ncbi:MAG: histidinol-phosphate transaminase [Bacillota bacterium]